jgi:hypothetical protein
MCSAVSRVDLKYSRTKGKQKKIFWNERTRQDRKLHPPTWWDVGFWWKRPHTRHTHTQERLDRASVCGYISGNLPQSTSYRSFQIFFPLASLSSWYHLVFFSISPFPLDFNRKTKIGMQSLLRSWKKTRQRIPNTGTKHREESSTTWEII